MSIRPMITAALFVAFASTSVTAATLPTLQTQDLNGTALVLPAGLPSDRTLLLIGFHHKDQKQIDEWVSGLDLKAGKIPWLEVSAIGRLNPLIEENHQDGHGLAAALARGKIAHDPLFR